MDTVLLAIDITLYLPTAPIDGAVMTTGRPGRGADAGTHIKNQARDLMSDNDPDVARGLVKALRLRMRKDSVKPDSKPPSTH